MTKLIAQVPTAVVVDGERRIFQPGQELPEIAAHDSAALVATGAAIDTKRQAEKAQAHAAAQAQAQAEMQAARAAVQAEQDSIAAPDAAQTNADADIGTDTATDTSTKPAARGSKKP